MAQLPRANASMAVTTADVVPATPVTHLSLRKLLAVGAGNALQFYDFMVFGLFATHIARTFFPVSLGSHDLLFSLATFGLGFLTRPLGAIVIGGYGDQAGRLPAMLMSFALMGIGTLGLALTPSYAQIGVAAPVLLLFFRLLQGFALGGQVGPSTAFLIEAAPHHRRGLYASIQQASQGVAILTAGVVGFAFSSLLSAEALQSWGWRAALLLGAAIVPVGLYVRRELPETLYESESAAEAPTRLQAPLRIVVLGLFMLGSMTIATYMLGYLSTFAHDGLKLATHLAFGVTVINGLAYTLVAPASGMLCDRFGRNRVMLSATAALWILVLPCFYILTQARSIAWLYIVTGLLGVATQMAAVAVLIHITEALPKSLRSVGLATMYAFAITIFGGSVQFVIQWLVEATGSPMAAGYYLTGALTIGGLAMLASSTLGTPRKTFDERGRRCDGFS